MVPPLMGKSAALANNVTPFQGNVMGRRNAGGSSLGVPKVR